MIVLKLPVAFTMPRKPSQRYLRGRRFSNHGCSGTVAESCWYQSGWGNHLSELTL